MEKITKAQFLADVRHEIDMLKKHATVSEIDRLYFEELTPESSTECIYGQMTGNCKSFRASQLIDLCCKRVVRNSGSLNSFKTILPVVNGIYNKSEFQKNRRSLDFFSSLEAYIMADKAKNEDVIAYIKGETDILTL